MNIKNVKSLFKKELLDVLRDKKTVIMMVIVPIIIYPLLMIVSLQVMNKITTGISEKIYVIAVESDKTDAEAKLISKYASGDYSLRIVEASNPEEALAKEEIDAYIRISEVDGKEKFEVYYISSVTNSNYAADRVSDLLNDYSLDLTKQKLNAAGLDFDEVFKPVDIKYKDTATSEEAAGSILSGIIPFMLVISLLMGTMYPAIDTTAGERERGTLETLLTLPVTNSEIIVSKFLVVAAIGITSAILNIISLIGVGLYMFKMTNSSMGTGIDVSIGKFIPAIIVGVLCVFSFAVFISAITMCVTAFAKTYKEANNYITPLSLVVMFASFIAFIPNVSLNERAALVPVANICLLVRDMLSFKFNAGVIMLVLLSNVLYGIIAICFLGKIYNSESILFGESAAGIQIFERRKNIKPGGVPELGDTVLVLAITMVAMIYIGGALQIKLGYFGVLGTQAIILMIPLLVAKYTKKDFKKTFKLKKCRALYLFAGVLMILGTMLLGMVLSAALSYLLPESTNKTVELQNSLINDNFILMLLVVAVAPAICEELMFRGYVFTALEKRFKPHTAMLITACFFGIYHMSMVRFIGTALLGYVICYMVHKSKSITTGMLMHFINNGFSCVLMFYPKKVGKIFPIFASEALSMVDVLFLVLMGALLLYAGYTIVNSLSKEKTA